MNLGLGLSLSRKAAGGGITLESSYSVDFGRKTLEGYGGWHPVDGVTSATITADDATNTGHWEVIDSYKIAPTAAGEGSLVASYSLEVTYYVGAAIAGVVTVNISTIADSYTGATATQVKALIEAAGLAYGETIYCRKGSYNTALSDVRFRRTAAPSGTFVPPSLIDAGDPDQGYNHAAANYVVVTAHAGETVVMTQVRHDMINDDGAGNPYGRGFRYTGLTFYIPPGNVNNTNCFEALNSVDGDSCYVCVDNNIIYSAASDADVDTDSPNIPTGVRVRPGSHYYIVNNVFYGLDFGILADSDNTQIVGNVMYSMWEDAINAYSYDNMLIAWNTIYDKKAYDASVGAHGDFIQLKDANKSTSDIRIIGNLLWRGDGLADDTDGQGIFIYNTRSPDVITNLVIEGNFYQGTFGNGIAVQAAQGAVIRFNTVISDPAQDVTGANTPRIVLDLCDGGTVQYNIAEEVAESNDVNPATISDNTIVDVDATSGDAAFSSVFDDPVDSVDIGSAAELIAAYAMKVSGPADDTVNRGAIGTGYFNYTNRTNNAP